MTGRVVWAGEGRSQATVTRFFNDLGVERAAALSFVTADGAEWIHTIVAEHAPDAIVCIDTFHVIGWATRALDEVRRHEWNRLRRTGGARAARQVKGLRWILLRNWQNLTSKQRDVIRDLEGTNLRYSLSSYRDLEELLAERGIEVDHVTVYRGLVIVSWVMRRSSRAVGV
jgi:transposase